MSLKKINVFVPNQCCFAKWRVEVSNLKTTKSIMFEEEEVTSIIKLYETFSAEEINSRPFFEAILEVDESKADQHDKPENAIEEIAKELAEDFLPEEITDAYDVRRLHLSRVTLEVIYRLDQYSCVKYRLG